jgi:selenide,water dikinase
VLRHLPRSRDENLLAGDNPADDAAVYRIGDDLALVQTVDFFTPVVDDPYRFGQIAAANSLSDVYAVGGKPLTALNIVGFPVNTLPTDVLSEILRGGADKAAEAGVAIVGGHTIDDDEPKYGLSVTGTVDPHAFISPRGAVAGDVLLLTKPIGTGVITTAGKAGAASSSHLSGAVRWMTTLNRAASRAMLQSGVHAATDVTGFGLLGHLADLCDASGVSAVVSTSRVPLLPGALEYVRAGRVPNGTRTNLEFALGVSLIDPGVSETVRLLLADSQTSGGLLVALPPEGVSAFERLASRDMLAAEIGRITPRAEYRIRVQE